VRNVVTLNHDANVQRRKKVENRIKFVRIYGDDKTIKIVSGDLPLPELMDSFKEFCLASGYHPSCVECIQYVETDDE
jgi:hypothetical protein